MARCCGCNSCGCKVQGGVGVSVAGTGSASDPFVISANMNITPVDNSTFNVILGGAGTLADPYELEVRFQPTSSISDLGDVDTTGASAGQVLGWDGAQWEPVAATTAPTGAVTHDTSLDGDGSGAAPLQVREDPDRLLTTVATGLGLSDEGMNSVVRHYTDTADRAVATPAPALNAISTLDTNPGEMDYWTGTEWLPITGSVALHPSSNQMLALSGTWDQQQVDIIVLTVTNSTDGSGNFTVFDAAALSGRAGVMGVTIQPVGVTPWVATVIPGSGVITARAWYLATGGPLTSQPITYTVTAYLY